MHHRLERLASLVREVVSEALMNRVSDPRVSRFTSVTRVSVSPDLAFADVHVSVMGDAAAGRTTLRGLTSARGMIQTILARQLSTRQCPTLRFHLDDSIKRGMETVRQLDQMAAERAARSSPPAPAGGAGQADDPDPDLDAGGAAQRGASDQEDRP